MIAGSAASPGDVQILWGSSMIDAMSWTKATTGKARQLDPDFVNARTANDKLSNFCDATATYGLGDLGTPGLANTQCNSALPPAGMCMDGAYAARDRQADRGHRPRHHRDHAEPGGAPSNNGTAGVVRDHERRHDWRSTSTASASIAPATRARPTVVAPAACKPLAPGGYSPSSREMATTRRRTAASPSVDATFGFSLVNNNGDVQVVDPTTCDSGHAVCVRDGLRQRVTWTTSDGPAVSSQTETAPHAEHVDGRTTMAANFCPGVSTYGTGTNSGTPFAANASN